MTHKGQTVPGWIVVYQDGQRQAYEEWYRQKAGDDEYRAMVRWLHDHPPAQ